MGSGPLTLKGASYEKYDRDLLVSKLYEKYILEEIFPIFPTIVVKPNCAPQNGATKIDFSRGTLSQFVLYTILHLQTQFYAFLTKCTILLLTVLV